MSLRLFPIIDTCRMLRQSAGLQDMRNPVPTRILGEDTCPALSSLNSDYVSWTATASGRFSGTQYTRKASFAAPSFLQVSPGARLTALSMPRRLC